MSQHKNGKEYVIAYASRSLTKAQRNYSVTCRELLAVVTFTKHFWQYLLGWQFLLRTDHHSLTWLTNFTNPDGQLARWLEKLSEYSFEVVVHRSGHKHNNADSLSGILIRTLHLLQQFQILHFLYFPTLPLIFVIFNCKILILSLSSGQRNGT